MDLNNLFEQSENEAVKDIAPSVSSTNGGANGAKQYLPTAYQVVKLVKTTRLGQPFIERKIIDTYSVENGMFEVAKHKAVTKAKMTGHCMVIEHCERSVIQIDEPSIQSETIMYKSGHKRKRARA